MPISASMLRAHLDCEHRTWMGAFGDPTTKRPVSAFQQMLFDEGARRRDSRQRLVSAAEHERARSRTAGTACGGSLEGSIAGSR